MRGLVIPADAQAPVRTAELDGLSDWQHAVGGCVELVQLRDDVVLFCNEEGWLHGLELNGRASMLAHDLGAAHWLPGDVLVFGWDAESCECLDVPEELASTILAHSG